MQKFSLELFLYYDGRYYTAMFIEKDEGSQRFARVVYGSDPSDQELLNFICSDAFRNLAFIEGEAELPDIVLAQNPKRRQRQAAKLAESQKSVSKAREALSAGLELLARGKSHESTEQRRAAEREKFKLKQQMKKQKKKGR